MTPLEVVRLSRSLLALGISFEQYRQISQNPDMSDEDLAEHLGVNTQTLQELKDKEHQ